MLVFYFYNLKVEVTQNSKVKNETDFYQDNSSVVKNKYSVLKREC